MEAQFSETSVFYVAFKAEYGAQFSETSVFYVVFKAEYEGTVFRNVGILPDASSCLHRSENLKY
jgi:hypothetical protein